MKVYVVSILAGVLVGAIYALMNVRSPAPPVVALLGLLGMLVGEQVVPLAKRLLSGQPVTATWLKQECAPRIAGVPPAPERPTPPEAGPDAGPKAGEVA